MSNKITSIVLFGLLFCGGCLTPIRVSKITPNVLYYSVTFADHATRPTQAISNSPIAIPADDEEEEEAQIPASPTAIPSTIPTYRPPRVCIVNGWIFITGVAATENVVAGNGDKTIAISGDGCRMILSNYTAMSTAGAVVTDPNKWRAFCLRDGSGDSMTITLNHGVAAQEKTRTLYPGQFCNIIKSGVNWDFEPDPTPIGEFSETNDGNDNTDGIIRWQINKVCAARRATNVDVP